jgi:hypothetical protein
MKYTNRTDFTKEYGRTSTSVIEKMKDFENQGLDDQEIQIRCLKEQYVKSSRTLYDYYRLFTKQRNNILWV